MRSFQNLSVGIAGCGWLGLPLAEQLVQQGAAVTGTTTTPAKLPLLEKAGIRPLLLQLHQPDARQLDLLLQTQVLVLNIPPKAQANGYDAYHRQLQFLLQEAGKARVEHVLFCSSTGVYGPLEGEVTEAGAAPNGVKAAGLLKAEALVTACFPSTATILRLGGLMGPGRHPGRFLAGREDVPNPLAPVNMICLPDAVRVIMEVIRQQAWSHTFNACADLHPTRLAFYTRAASLLGLAPPVFELPLPAPYTLVSNQKLKRQLQYEFQFPDPLLALEQL